MLALSVCLPGEALVVFQLIDDLSRGHIELWLGVIARLRHDMLNLSEHC